MGCGAKQDITYVVDNKEVRKSCLYQNKCCDDCKYEAACPNCEIWIVNHLSCNGCPLLIEKNNADRQIKIIIL